MAWFGAAMLLAGCGQSSQAPAARTGDAQDAVIRGTDAMLDFGAHVVYVNDVSDGETLIYTVAVTPADERSPLSLRYQTQYFVDG